MNSLLQLVYIMQASLIPYIQLWSSTLGTPCKDIEEHHGHLGSRKEQCFLTHARATTTAFLTDDQCQASEVHWAKWFRLLLHFLVLLHIAPEKEWNFVWLDVRNQWDLAVEMIWSNSARCCSLIFKLTKAPLIENADPVVCCWIRATISKIKLRTSGLQRVANR